MKIKTQNIQTISLNDWDKMIEETYGKIYSLQQQNGCMSRQVFNFTVPKEDKDFENVEIPEVVNGAIEGIRFDIWLKTEPKITKNLPENFEVRLFWERNFYPKFQILANDLHKKGLIDAGNYAINIDW